MLSIKKCSGGNKSFSFTFSVVDVLFGWHFNGIDVPETFARQFFLLRPAVAIRHRKQMAVNR